MKNPLHIEKYDKLMELVKIFNKNSPLFLIISVNNVKGNKMYLT